MLIKQILYFLTILLFTELAWADIDGSMEDNGDGTYTVQVQKPNGHRYEGFADPNCDGTMTVDIHDHNDEYYSGYGLYQGGGMYDVGYLNDSGGYRVPGHLVEY